MTSAAPHHVILTGLPRAGSSSLGALIDGLPDQLYLNSPEWHWSIAGRLLMPLPMCKWLVGEFYWQHKLASEGAQLRDYREPDGSPLFDGGMIHPLSPPPPGMIRRNELTPSFTLTMRHTTLYTALLPHLVHFEHFRILAVVRNPIDILLSWQNHPQQVPAIDSPRALESLWPEAHSVAASLLPPLEKQVQLVELFFQRYLELKDFIEIIRYEDLAANPSLASALYETPALSIHAPRLKRKTSAQAGQLLESIRELLAKYGTCCRALYPH